eukprot:3070237-Pyramimonas_sp.AAC.1
MKHSGCSSGAVNYPPRTSSPKEGADAKRNGFLDVTKHVPLYCLVELGRALNPNCTQGHHTR